MSTAPAEVLGADVDALRALSSGLGSGARTVEDVAARTTTTLSSVDWQGPDAAGFRDAWNGSHQPALAQVAAALQEAERRAAEQAAEQETASNGPVHLQVPWYSQIVGGNGFTPSWTACFLASRAMAAQAGATVLGPDRRIQVATGENADGTIVADPTRATEGRAYVDSELDAGRPVVVGVSHRDGYRGNVDRITDHFVVITGRDTDDQGRTFYTFHDPATRHEDKGSDDVVANRFHVTGAGVLRSDGQVESGEVVGRQIEVAMVRRNAESD